VRVVGMQNGRSLRFVQLLIVKSSLLRIDEGVISKRQQREPRARLLSEPRLTSGWRLRASLR
jgi:hypothetical protein